MSFWPPALKLILSKMSHLEEQFASLWEYAHPNLDLHREYRFHPKRRYRADFASLEAKVLIEIQGGIWGQ